MRNIYQLCFLTLLLLVQSTVSAEMYKWTDENGQVHYSQQPPQGIEAKEIKAPPPPTIDPRDAQQKIDKLIAEQEDADRQKVFEKALKKQKEQQQENDKKRCEIATNNLKKYQSHPSRKLLNKDGSVTILTEEDRQKRISALKEKVNVYCQ